MKNIALMYDEILKVFKHFGGIHTGGYGDLKQYSKTLLDSQDRLINMNKFPKGAEDRRIKYI